MEGQAGAFPPQDRLSLGLFGDTWEAFSLLLCCSSARLPRCYQELKSPKPALFFSFFAAVLVEGPSSSTLRFLEQNENNSQGPCTVGWELGILPLPAAAQPLSARGEHPPRASMGTQGVGTGAFGRPQARESEPARGDGSGQALNTCSKPNFSRPELKI